MHHAAALARLLAAHQQAILKQLEAALLKDQQQHMDLCSWGRVMNFHWVSHTPDT